MKTASLIAYHVHSARAHTMERVEEEYEHNADLRLHRMSNSITLHAQDRGHFPRWQESRALHTGLEKNRGMIEAAYISTRDSPSYRKGFFKLTSTAATLYLEEVTNNVEADGTVGRNEEDEGFRSADRGVGMKTRRTGKTGDGNIGGGSRGSDNGSMWTRRRTRRTTRNDAASSCGIAEEISVPAVNSLGARPSTRRTHHTAEDAT